MAVSGRDSRGRGKIGVARSRYLAGAAANGALWGVAGVCFFVPESYVHQTLLAFVLAGMSAGAVATLSSVPGAALFFLIPALLPYSVRVVVDGTLIHIIMGSMVVLFVLMMSVIADRLQNNVSESLRLRFENIRLVNSLRRAKKRQDAVNRALSAELAPNNGRRSPCVPHTVILRSASSSALANWRSPTTVWRPRRSCSESPWRASQMVSSRPTERAASPT